MRYKERLEIKLKDFKKKKLQLEDWCFDVKNIRNPAFEENMRKLRIATVDVRTVKSRIKNIDKPKQQEEYTIIKP